MSKVNNELEKLSSTGNDNEIFENKILTKEDKNIKLRQNNLYRIIISKSNNSSINRRNIHHFQE